MGAVLAVQNERTVAALRADGHKVTLVKAGAKVSFPFSDNPQEQKKFAAMGEALAGSDGKPPIVWPDMQALAQKLKVEKAPMSEETKEKLREYTAANPRDVGDEVAIMLRDCKSVDDVYKVAAKYLGVPETELRERYAKLNAGQQRMNCGNRMRAKWKKDNLKADTRQPKYLTKEQELKAAQKADVKVVAKAKK